MPSRTAPTGIQTIVQVVPASPPSIQRSADCVLWGSLEVTTRKLATADSTSAIATPASTSRTVVIRPPERARKYTATRAARAPQNAASGSENGPNSVTLKTRTSTAPTLAPDDTPSSIGSASGLRTRACSAIPATDSPAPTTAHSSTRGSRTSVTIVSRTGGQVGSARAGCSWWSRMPHTSPAGMVTEPAAIPTVAATATKAPQPGQHESVGESAAAGHGMCAPAPGELLPTDSATLGALPAPSFSASRPAAAGSVTPVTGSGPGGADGPATPRPRAPGRRRRWRTAAAPRTAGS